CQGVFRRARRKVSGIVCSIRGGRFSRPMA
ncbi:MAG: hypothetical protein AVDCRST_MAG80-76, partial [uncultured Rubrobacteraceae bacterium]